MIYLDIQGEDEVLDMLNTKASVWVGSLAGKMDSIAQELSNKVRENLSGGVLQTRSGTLLASVDEQLETSGDNTSAVISAGGSQAPYGEYHEYGTSRPYDIVPVNKQFLHFFVNGKEVFTKLVHHPPIQQRSFLQSAMDELGDAIVEDIGSVFV